MENTRKLSPGSKAPARSLTTKSNWAMRTSLLAVAAVSTPIAAKNVETPSLQSTAGSHVVASVQAEQLAASKIRFVSIPVIQGQVKDAASTAAIGVAIAQPKQTVAPEKPKAVKPVAVTKFTAVEEAKPLSAEEQIQGVANLAPAGVQVNEDKHNTLKGAPVNDRENERSEEEGISTSGDDHEIRFRADTLVIRPVLNVGLVDSIRTAAAGETISFMTYNNYPAFVEKSEIRILRASQAPDAEPLAIVEVDRLGAGRWQVPEAAPSALSYILRVYGRDGVFDETFAQELTIVDKHVASLAKEKSVDRPNFGTVDEAERRNINLGGMMASVTGFADPNTDLVFVAGQPVPVDLDGRFAAQQIVARRGPASKLGIVIERNGRKIHEVEQSFATPKDDWFIVGQGEVTIGESFGVGPAVAVTGDSTTEGTYAIGRGAFYAKGVIGDDDGDDKDDIRITASLDTGETLLEDIFSNLDRKDPTQLLRRLNRDQFYPTYGDNSTLVEDAPTQGRFYLRVAKDDSQLVVGNFTTSVNGAELAQLDRGLFGALVDYNSENLTSFGEREVQITAFASDPGTLPAREEFRGTGGSLYFLERQDISIGSERVRIEVRDRNTGIVKEVRELYPNQDYDFDPYQGRITLLTPLASTVANGRTVREGSSAGDVPVLVVRYEYSPLVGDLEGYTVGGRASAWLGDKVKLGLTAQRDTVEEASQTLIGSDVTVRLTPGTYLRGEIAQTDGPGFGQSNSVDGGLTFTQIANPGANVKAQAWRTEGAVNFGELAGKSSDLGKAYGYYEDYEAGFASSGNLTPSDTTRWGVGVDLPISDAVSIAAKYDELTSDNTGTNQTGTVDVAGKFAAGTGTVTTKLGLRYEDRVPGTLFNSVQDGSRTDVAAEIEYAPTRNVALYAFGQATLDRDASRQRNDRYGGGIKAQLSERISVAGELSGGDGGLGGDIQLNHRLGDGSEAYVGYSIFADRTDTGFDSQNVFTRSNRSTLTVGARQRFSQSLSVYGENRIGIGGSAPSLTRSFGLTFEPTEKLSFNGSFENGRIDDVSTGVFERTAGSIGIGYVDDGIRYGSSVEVRVESGATIDQTVWLLRNDLSVSVDPSWTALARFNMARADQSSTSIAAAEFTEAVAGLAFRPVNNERFNALVRLTYFEDLGPVGQVTGSGETQSPKQTSAIVNIDANYDLSEKLTLGAKYGYRFGEVSLTRNSDIFVSSDAHLGVIRADYHVNKKWDLLVEGRALWVTQADDMRLGALGAVYRHLGNNVKVGLGYSLSDFSDDLTDQSFSSHGPFLNILSKF